ncbi:TetR/AcrR family transcriptional regulator [Leucobacter japonicus]|uniref:TetR/AcrR family transcriptional regulator n=1 Tax=Leucobacter japonicus TaxID=1461259 RepID=UPI0006A7B640|nr:TetR/AcrR family transcriptional regulator [Leucobacter japonicus]
MPDGSKRVRLDQRSIVDGVLDLARTEPGSRVTFKRLGEHLGVDASAMYRHFRNKDELVRASLDRLSGWAAEAGRAATGTWRERVEVMVTRTAELSLEHPAIGMEGAVTDPAGPGDASAVEFLLEMLTEAGLSGDELIRCYAAVSGFMLAHSSAMAHEAFNRHPGARDGSIPWISTFGPITLSDYPLVNAHRDALLAVDGMAVYRAGVAAILDSIERGGPAR